MQYQPPSPRDTFRGFVLLFMIGIALLPEVARHLVVMELESQIAAPVRIKDVDVNIFTGHARVSNLLIGGANGSLPILKLPRVDLGLSQRALLRGEVVVRSLTLRGPHLVIERIGPGRYTIREVMRLPEDSSWLPAWFGIDRVAIGIEDGEVTFVDQTTTPAAKAALRDIQLTLDALDLAPDAEPGLLDGEGRLGDAPVRVTGTLQPNPFTTRLTLTATDVQLESFQDYFDGLLGTPSTLKGSLDGRLEISLAPPKEGALNAEINGSVKGRKLAFGFSGEKDPIVTAKRVAIDLARTGRTSTPHTQGARIQVVGATLRLKRDRNGKLNLRRLLGQGRETAKTSKPASPKPKDRRIAINRLNVAQSRIEFVDAKVTPAFTGVLSNVTAAVHHQAGPKDRATLRLRGILGDYAPLEVRGWFTPLQRPLRLEVEGTLDNYELSRLNRYAEKYVGYRIRRGKVTTKGKYKYTAGKLSSTNEITLRKIQLGKKVGPEFEKRVGIPLGLALAILEDANDEIHLSVPVNGKLNSPEVSLKGVVLKAFGNTLFKVITAPFRVLGEILTVGGKIGEIRIKPVEFLPGSLKATRPGRKQLNKVAQFLKNKPKIELEVRGRATTKEAKALKKKRRRSKKTKKRTLPKLAQDRARLIQRILVRRGVAPKRLFVVKEAKGAVTDSPRGRVEFELLY
ncbi:MAG: DUF748 domain-containing protein [Candidatus Methylomirabilia bacterium]